MFSLMAPLKDKMIDNDHYVQLSEYYSNICETLKIAVNADDLNESVRIALEDLERFVNYVAGSLFVDHSKQFQAYMWDRADPQGRSEHAAHRV